MLAWHFAGVTELLSGFASKLADDSKRLAFFFCSSKK
jgi:hypothetical protein